MQETGKITKQYAHLPSSLYGHLGKCIQSSRMSLPKKKTHTLEMKRREQWRKLDCKKLQHCHYLHSWEMFIRSFYFYSSCTQKSYYTNTWDQSRRVYAGSGQWHVLTLVTMVVRRLCMSVTGFTVPLELLCDWYWWIVAALEASQLNEQL